MEDGSSVIPLAQLRGFRIANGAPDMRLWQVHSGDGRWIGTVDELLVDRATMQVRYLDVEVENLLATGRERHVLIPVDHVRPDPEHSNTVVVDGLTARAAARLPAYDPGAGYARPFAAARNAASEKLDFPIRVAAPRTGRVMRVAAPAAAGRTPATRAAGAKKPAEPAMQLAAGAVHAFEPRAA